MILFVFEGEEREPRIFKTIKRLFFGEWEIIICSGNCSLPEVKDEVSQANIFSSQQNKYLKVDDTVAILNAFPLFLFEYFKELK